MITVPDHPRQWCQQPNCPHHPPLESHLVIAGSDPDSPEVAVFDDPGDAETFVAAYNASRHPHHHAKVVALRRFVTGEWAGQQPTTTLRTPGASEWTPAEQLGRVGDDA